MQFLVTTYMVGYSKYLKRYFNAGWIFSIVFSFNSFLELSIFCIFLLFDLDLIVKFSYLATLFVCNLFESSFSFLDLKTDNSLLFLLNFAIGLFWYTFWENFKFWPILLYSLKLNIYLSLFCNLVSFFLFFIIILYISYCFFVI